MNKWLNLYVLMLGVTSLLPSLVFAHTGMGGTAGFVSGFSHPLGGADHLLVMLAVGLWAAQIGGRAIWAVPCTFVALMIVGAVLAIAGIQVPYVEAAILISLLLLGLLIASAFRLPLAISVSVVGCFAVFHGQAHGAEMPLTIDALTYCAGFALATILLHTLGIATGVMLQTLQREKTVRFIGAAIALGGVYLAVA
jgi:urease accessory protein